MKVKITHAVRVSFSEPTGVEDICVCMCVCKISINIIKKKQDHFLHIFLSLQIYLYTHILEVDNCSDLQIPLETFALTPNHDNKIKINQNPQKILFYLFYIFVRPSAPLCLSLRI